MKTSIITDQLSPDFETACRIAKEQGFSYVDIHNVANHSVETCTPQEAHALKAILDKYGLHCANLATTIFFLCPLHQGDQVSLFNPDFHAITGSVSDHLVALDNAISVARILDCSSIRLFPFRYPDNRSGIAGTPADLDRIETFIRQAVQKAEAAGILLVLENCPYSHLPKGKMTAEIVRRIHSPNLSLLWDPANSYRAETDQVPPEYLADSLEEEGNAILSLIGHVHLKNYTYVLGLPKPFVHKPLLLGDIDYDALKPLLALCPCLSLEPEVDLDGTLASMHQLQTLTR